MYAFIHGRGKVNFSKAGKKKTEELGILEEGALMRQELRQSLLDRGGIQCCSTGQYEKKKVLFEHYKMYTYSSNNLNVKLQTWN